MITFASIRVHSWFLLLPLALSLPGCAGYQVGAETLYPAEISTVYVPMFDSQSFRRNLGERLTEAVVKEIQLKTPYRVVTSANADSILTGRLLSDTRRVVAETPTDEPRQLQLNMVVEVTWTDRTGVLLGESRTLPVPEAVANISLPATLTPEVGESVEVAQQKAIQRLAEQIVSLMEAPW